MTARAPSLELSRCESCQLRFLPNDGACPRCGSRDTKPLSVPALGTVLVATELMYPATGWESPHRLALVEVAETVRLLAIVEGTSATNGDVVSVVKDGDVYRIHTDPTATGERGEGDSPKAGLSAPSFEPPR
jgi:uncharacterized OB-fold protein